MAEARTPEDVYKSHLEPSSNFLFFEISLTQLRKTILGVRLTKFDSIRLQIATTFTNGFLNLGFCCDKLMGEDASKWLYKNKNHGKKLIGLALLVGSKPSDIFI